MLKELENDNLSEIVSSEPVVVVQYSAGWCGNCRIMKPKFKKMASENNPEDMIKVAKKYFKVKCYGTEQIKDLSYLFLTDKGKYMFFDAAYPFGKQHPFSPCG